MKIIIRLNMFIFFIVSYFLILEQSVYADKRANTVGAPLDFDCLFVPVCVGTNHDCQLADATDEIKLCLNEDYMIFYLAIGCQGGYTGTAGCLEGEYYQAPGSNQQHCYEIGKCKIVYDDANIPSCIRYELFIRPFKGLVSPSCGG